MVWRASPVALHPEGVDRNIIKYNYFYLGRCVALHPEGVDRNTALIRHTVGTPVALHPEGVDRNPVIMFLSP